MTYVFFLGSNPSLSATECWRALTSLDLAPTLRTVTADVLIVETSHELPDTFLSRLGGIDRIGTLLAQWSKEPSAEDILAPLTPLPDKWVLGLSTVNTSQNINLKRLAIGIKKEAKAKGSRLTFILPSHGTRLNTAQVLFNDLHRHPQSELTLLQLDGVYLLIRTTAIQDIASYELRDTKRPARNAKVGMLPPKLAQIMLNIAASEREKKHEFVILDPFCGTGTILQEGWLMGYTMRGSDASETMTAAAQENLQWLRQHFAPDPAIQPDLQVHDVQYSFPHEWNETIDAIVTEPHLGRPLHAPLPFQELRAHIAPLLVLYRAFFRHARAVLKPHGRLLCLFPVIKVQEGHQRRLVPFPASFLDDVSQIGYRMETLLPEEFTGQVPVTDRGTIVYGRPDAIVSREVTLWQKAS